VLWFSFWGGNYGSFALLKPDGSPSLPAITYIAAADKLDSMKFIGLGNRGEKVRSLRFSNGARTLEVIWCTDGKYDMILEPNVIISDMYGFPIPRVKNIQKFVLSSLPVYLENRISR
jgi:hypothetical protein